MPNPQVLIRELEPAVIARLKKRARSHGRSFEAELRLVLTDAAEESMPDFRAEVERIQRLFAGQTFPDSTSVIRHRRDQQ